MMTEGLRARLQTHLPIAVLIALILIVGLYDRTFFSLANFLSVTADTMTLFLMASGVTLVIMIGGIDLSIQAVASMASCILAVYLPRYGFFAVPLSTNVDYQNVHGLVNGTGGKVVRLEDAADRDGLVKRFFAVLNVPVLYPDAIKLPAEVTEVSGLVITAAYWFSETRSVNIPGELSDAYLGWAVGETLGVPREILVGLACLAVLSAILALTPFGRLVRAIGSQERAVIASGIDADRTKVMAYALSGTMAAIAGVVMAARLGSGSPILANEFLLPAIACIVVGGTAITGGVGSVWRTFIGALIVQVVRIGMTFMGVSVFAQQIVFGFILVAAVAITMDRAKISVIK